VLAAPEVDDEIALVGSMNHLAGGWVDFLR
jgi:hypothetical protein